MIEEQKKDCKEKMQLSLEHLRIEMGKVRTGRATTGILDDIKVSYYGTPTPISQAATVAAPDSQTITIQPWDASIIKDIEKAILTSDIGLTPSNDGKLVRLTIPPLTSERRQQLAKQVKKHGEECKVALRNIRREVNDKIKAAEKNSEVSEDDSRKAQDEIQKMTDKFSAEAEAIALAKEKDILEV